MEPSLPRGWGEAAACKSCWGGSFGSGRTKPHTEERCGERALPATEQHQLHHYPNIRGPDLRSTWLQIRRNCDHERRGTASWDSVPAPAPTVRRRQTWHRPDKMAFIRSVYVPPVKSLSNTKEWFETILSYALQGRPTCLGGGDPTSGSTYKAAPWEMSWRERKKSRRQQVIELQTSN